MPANCLSALLVIGEGAVLPEISGGITHGDRSVVRLTSLLGGLTAFGPVSYGSFCLDVRHKSSPVAQKFCERQVV